MSKIEKNMGNNKTKQNKKHVRRWKILNGIYMYDFILHRIHIREKKSQWNSKTQYTRYIHNTASMGENQVENNIHRLQNFPTKIISC